MTLCKILWSLSASSLLALMVCRAALPEIPADLEGAQTWKSRRLATIRELQSDKGKMIPGLAEMLKQLRTLGYRPCSELDEITSTIQTALLSTPGHAKYYQDKIETMRAEVLANARKSEEELNAMQAAGGDWVDEWSYDTYCFHTFQTLRLMPSAETVAVLGHFLNDPEGRDGKSLVGTSLAGTDDGQGRSFNAMGAAMAIGNLGIEHPPYTIPGPLGAAFIDAWKDWWNEVAAGKRTYRFAGSPIEYGPDGQVSADKLQAIERDRRRDEQRAAGHRTAPPPAAAPTGSPAAAIIRQPGILAGIIAAGLAIAAALWYVLRARRRHG